MPTNNAPINRRQLVSGSLAGAALIALPGTAIAHRGERPVPGLISKRLTLPSGVASGDVSSNSAVLWARSSGPGRLHATLQAISADGAPLRGRFARGLRLTSGWANPTSDHTAKIFAGKLPSGTRFKVTYAFEDDRGRMGERAIGTFTTAPGKRFGPKTSAAQSFVWTADTAGQGYGINEDLSLIHI